MPLTLEQLASDWIRPQDEEHFSLPAITNFRGMVQAGWGVAGIQNWICPPTGMATLTARLFVLDGRHYRELPTDGCEYRWKAYEVERRGHGVSSALRMPAGRFGVIEKLRFERPMQIALVFTGLPRVWRFTDYWNLPPEDVPQFNLTRIDGGFLLDDVKTFGWAEFCAPGKLTTFASLQHWLDGAPPRAPGRVGVAELSVFAGDEIAWTALQGCEVRQGDGSADSRPALPEDWDSGRDEWRRVWDSAFTSDNADFGGSLPAYDGPLARLYYISVLTLLMTRRIVPAPTPRSSIATGGQCIWSEAKRPLSRAYVWGGPEGAPTTSFLWEVEFQAPLLARLDPAVLRHQLEALMRVDLSKHWGVEVVSGGGAGMGYGVNPGAFLSCVRDYVHFTGDRAWALRRLDYLRSCARPGLTDYGDCQNILECVSTYEHSIAAFNALNVAGMRFLAELTGEPEYTRQADALAKQVLSLYADGPFACLQPDGSRRIVKTVLDFNYVGRFMAADLPVDMKAGMLRYFEAELQTEDWLYALAPHDPDALTPHLPKFQTFRADHQATGSYDGWPARAACVLARFGQKQKAVDWMLRIQELTREGPFGQARYIHAAPPNDGLPGRTRKASFFNGNCYFESAGCGFATVILDEL